MRGQEGIRQAEEGKRTAEHVWRLAGPHFAHLQTVGVGFHLEGPHASDSNIAILQVDENK